MENSSQLYSVAQVSRIGSNHIISWNKKEPFIVSGGDDGVIKVWDLRKIQEKKSVAYFKHHTGPITSIEWCPQDSSVFAASGEDNQVTQVNIVFRRF